MANNYRTEGCTVFRKDYDGHKYVIPAELGLAFDLILDKVSTAVIGTDVYYNLHDELNAKFGKFMMG